MISYRGRYLHFPVAAILNCECRIFFLFFFGGERMCYFVLKVEEDQKQNQRHSKKKPTFNQFPRYDQYF